ncbi:hypothetical protein ACJIZ3_015609 [Penstemon smallii]|uniref:Uncharacterized protein n=1 Tax=Penstemon smallii TaxID=265156 RepID=A0ABD3RQX7_9LAMI
MYRQSPSRNQRSKGIKAKHILQICLLLAVCFWLIYQVKHSHDKKKEFDESDAKTSLHEQEFLKLGRKDINPRLDKTNNKIEKHDEAPEEDEEEITEEKEEDNKNEGPEDKKIVETEGGENEIDEHEQENTEEEFVDDEKESDDSNENEPEEKDSEDAVGQTEKEIPVKHTDQESNDREIHEAREENYKADDASSAVTHDTQTTATEVVENSNEHLENKENNSEETNGSEIRRESEGEEGENAKDENRSNVTTIEIKENTLENSSLNDTETNGSHDHLVASNNSTEFASENHESSLQNMTESESNSETISLEHANNSTLDVDNKHFDSNSTISTETKDAELSFEDFSTVSNNTKSSASGKFTKEASVDADNNTESSEEENSDIGDGVRDEVLASETTVDPEEVLHESTDLSDSSNSLEEKDVRTDLDTLPEIQTEGTNSEDAAEE